jgi:hypothetical protein
MRIWILLSFLVLNIHAFAQEFRGGITGGVLSSQVDGDLQGGYNKASFHVGAFVQRPVFDKIDANMEIRYIRKGALSNATDENGYYINYFRTRMNYVEIPFTLLYKSGSFRFEAGMALGALVNTSLEDGNGEIGEKLNIYNYELSVIGGMFYEVDDNWQINFRAQYSALPIYDALGKDITVLYYGQRYWFNNLISFGLYYYIR